MIAGFRWFGRSMTMLAALALLYGLWVLADTGAFDPVPVGEAASCTILETGVRISDAVADTEMGVAYLAGFDDEEEPARGALYVLDLRAAHPQLLPMTPPDDLHPAGLGLYVDAGGTRSLFVIDRHPGAPRVRIFDVEGARATLRETVSDPAFRSLIDVAPVTRRAFYITNDRRRGLSGLAQTIFRLPSSEVLYFDGTLADPAATGLVTARGLVLSNEGGALSVAEGLAHRIRIFARDDETGALRETKRLSLDAVPDKLDADAEGKLWLTEQAQLFRLFLHRLSPRFAAPTRILELDPTTAARRVIYVDKGGTFRNARVAVFGDGVLVAASPSEPKLLLCRLG